MPTPTARNSPTELKTFFGNLGYRLKLLEQSRVTMPTPTAHNSPTELKTFFGNLGYRLKLLEQSRAHTDIFLSTRFNVFDYIEPDENRVSDIIADFLNPAGAHAQGDRFLRAFLEAVCGRAGAASGFRCITREEPTSFIESDRRRMDILVELDELAIGVENKPWAVEQLDQIVDYVSDLRRRFGQKFLIVFLSPVGSEPTSLPAQERAKMLSQHQLVCAGYNGKFRQWLGVCVKECCSDKIRWLLRDFISFVDAEFGSTPIKT